MKDALDMNEMTDFITECMFNSYQAIKDMPPGIRKETNLTIHEALQHSVNCVIRLHAPNEYSDEEYQMWKDPALLQDLYPIALIWKNHPDFNPDWDRFAEPPRLMGT